MKTYVWNSLCRPSLWIVLGLALWSPFGNAHAQDWIEAGMGLWPTGSWEHAVVTRAHERVRRATVSIRVLERRVGSAAVVDALGSGVVVHSDRRGDDRYVWIATSAHVVPCRARCSVRVGLPSHRGSELWRSAKVMRFDSASDLALLEARVPEEAEFSVVEPSAEGIPRDNRVWALGYPDPELLSNTNGSRRVERFSVGHLLRDPGSFRAEYRALSSRGADGRLTMRHALLHTATLVPGASGGPLVDAFGRVVGINTGALVSKKREQCLRRAELIEAGDGAVDNPCIYLASGLEKVWDWVEALKRRQPSN